MLSVKFIAENKDLMKKTCQQKNIDLDIDLLVDLNQKIVDEEKKIQDLSTEKNSITKQFPQAKSQEEKSNLTKKSQELTSKIKELESKIAEERVKFKEMMLNVPNIVSPDTPIGKDDDENVEVKRVGEPTKFDFEPKDHITILLEHNWADFDNIANISGSRSYALKNDMVLLERAIQQLAMEKLISKGFTLFSFPSFAKEYALWGTGHFPAGRDDVYQTGEDEFLTGTAEVQLNALNANKILNESDLPLKYAGFSSCFRKEAGSHGKDVKGLVRVHQFTKVEQYIICKADIAESEKMHQLLLHNAEEILQDLELPYRVIANCTGDMGMGKYKMFDVEAWVPTQNKYRETHSCSNLTDWQARRTNIRYKDKNGKVQFAYTLNNTAIATPRALVPFIENHQTKDGRIYIPVALRKYLGGREYLG